MSVKWTTTHPLLLIILLSYTGFLAYIIYDRGMPLWNEHSLKYIGDWERSVHYVVSPDVPQSFANYLLFVRKAASHGYHPAEYLLGLAYFHGSGVQKSQSQAFYWIAKSAHAGFPPAENALGTAYYHGWGTPKSMAQAEFWINAAAVQGNKAAKMNMKYFIQSHRVK